MYTRHYNPNRTPQNQPIPGSTQVKNYAGGYAWEVDKWKQLDRFLILGSEGGTYYVGEAKLTVSFNEPSGRLVAAFTPPEDDEEDAALVSEEEFSSRALSRDTRPMAGFDGVSTPVLIPESRVEPALPLVSVGE